MNIASGSLAASMSGATDETDAAVRSIRVASGVVPAVAVGAATVVMVAYPLTERAFRRIIAETAQRRARAERPTATTPV